MSRFLKSVIGGAVLVGAVLATAPLAPALSSTARPAAVIIGIAWIPACILMARQDRRQQAEKAQKARAQQPASRSYL